MSLELSGANGRGSASRTGGSASGTGGDTVIRAGIALTGVGGSTISAAEAAAALAGKPLSLAAIEEAADLAAGAAQPRSDHRGSAAYKRHMVRTLTARILAGALPSTTRPSTTEEAA